MNKGIIKLKRKTNHHRHAMSHIKLVFYKRAQNCVPDASDSAVGLIVIRMRSWGIGRAFVQQDGRMVVMRYGWSNAGDGLTNEDAGSWTDRWVDMKMDG